MCLYSLVPYIYFAVEILEDLEKRKCQENKLKQIKSVRFVLYFCFIFMVPYPAGYIDVRRMGEKQRDREREEEKKNDHQNLKLVM